MLSSSQFHLPCPRGAQCTAQEMVVADERKRLKREKAKKHTEHQRRGDSSSDDDDDDGDDEDIEDEYGDPAILRSIPDVF